MPWRESIYSSSEVHPKTGEPMIRFGDWLIRRGLIDLRQRNAAIDAATTTRCRLGDALVDMDVLERGCVEQEASAHDQFTAFHRPSHLTAVLLDAQQ